MDTGIQFAGADTTEARLAGMGSDTSRETRACGRYMVVPQGYEPNGGGLIWIADFADAHGPSRYWLRVEPQGSAATPAGEARCRDIPVAFDRAAEGLRYTRVKLVLQPGLHYRLALWRCGEQAAEVVARGECWGRPDSLAQGFNVWYGTCFYRPADKGALGEALAALPAAFRPQVSFLGGDQVYLDTAFSNTGLSVVPGFSTRNFSPLLLRSRAVIRDKLNRVFSREYRENWRNGLSTQLRSGFHYFLAGDHEFWNDYPNPPGFLPVLWSRKVRDIWQSCARQLFDAYQSSSNHHSIQFDVGDALRFFVLDTRLQRGRGRDGCFTDETTFARLSQWLRELDRPGVLVLPAPLLTRWQFRKRDFLKSLRVRLGLGDHSLADTGQYQDLVRALHDCPQDVLILAGDVHFSRFAQFELGGKQVVEVVSSPLACLPSAVAQRELTPGVFPDRPTDDIRAEVQYLHAGRNQCGEKKETASERGSNNFVTLGFKPGADEGDVRVEVICWNINGRDDCGAPLVDWKVPDLVLRRRPLKSCDPVAPELAPVSAPIPEQEPLVAEAG